MCLLSSHVNKLQYLSPLFCTIHSIRTGELYQNRYPAAMAEPGSISRFKVYVRGPSFGPPVFTHNGRLAGRRRAERRRTKAAKPPSSTRLMLRSYLRPSEQLQVDCLSLNDLLHLIAGGRTFWNRDTPERDIGRKRRRNSEMSSL